MKFNSITAEQLISEYTYKLFRQLGLAPERQVGANTIAKNAKFSFSHLQTI